MDAPFTGRAWACPFDERSNAAHWDLAEYIQALQHYALVVCSADRIEHPSILVAHTSLGRTETPSLPRAVFPPLRALGVRAVLAPQFAKGFKERCLAHGILALGFEFHEDVECEDNLVIDPEVGDVRNESTGWAFTVARVPRRVCQVWREAQLAPPSAGANARRAHAALRTPRA